jgi:DNA recombination protein RmuC
MEAAVVVVGAVALLATALALFLLVRLLNTQGRSHGQEGALGHQVGEIRTGIDRVSEAIQNLNVDRGQQSARLEEMLTTLNSSSSALQNILANTQVRGQWGERMAEDVFRIIGLVEHVNYVKQTTVTDGSSRPDFTIFMPNDKKLNMDAKFPLTNYVRYVEAESEEEARQHSLTFLRDVRDRAKEVVGRDYINPEDNTLDYVLVFIPNEQMFHHIQQHGASVVEEALRNRVVLCSPISLFAILSVIRHALDNFAIEQASDQILSELAIFDRQWRMFTDQMDTVSKRIESAQSSFESLRGTRTRMLGRPLQRIQDIRKQRGIPDTLELASSEAEDPTALPESDLVESNIDEN